MRKDEITRASGVDGEGGEGLGKWQRTKSLIERVDGASVVEEDVIAIGRCFLPASVSHD